MREPAVDLDAAAQGVGAQSRPESRLRGYHLDLSLKAKAPRWPPEWLEAGGRLRPVATAQWALGAYERYLKDGREAWLVAATRAGEFLLEQQVRGGVHDGGWLHTTAMPHTYAIQPPWLSAMAQGEGASLLVRLHLETGDARFADAARHALRPMKVPSSDGGVLALLDGAEFVEEYPTDPPSFVLNGAIFALWGYYDVGRVLGDSDAAKRFTDLGLALASRLGRFDTGRWSRYDLYPHPVVNVASPFYHALHITQLQVLNGLLPRPEFVHAIGRFEAYRRSRSRRARALAAKVIFRMMVPRNRLLAQRLPWRAGRRAASA